MLSRKLSVLSIAVLALLCQPALFAHAILVQATPKQDSTVAGPNITVVLKFNSRIDSKRSTLSLLLPDSKVKPLAITENTPPDTLGSEAGDLVPGKYRLRWQVLATDGHITRGDFAFTVR
jgi:methionine-rich copper-binding protein CopC